jgi:HEAT repeat protein
MYPPTSKVVQENMEALVAALDGAFAVAPAFTLSHRGNALVVNGQPVDKEHAEGQFQEAVAGIFRAGSIKSLTFVAPPRAEELLAFLQESGRHTPGAAVPRQQWRVFAREHRLQSLGIVQKTLTLQNRQDQTGRLVQGPQRVAETDLPLVKDLVRHLMAAVEGIRKHPPGSKVTGEALALLDRSLRQLFALVPAVAVHEGEEEHLVVNGTALAATGLGGGAELLRYLRESQLRGFVLMRELSPRELARFVTLLAKLPTPAAPGEGDAAGDKISADASFPNVLVGRAMLQLARDLVGKPETKGKAPAPGASPPPPPAPIARDPDLPAHFTWPTDAMIQRAETLSQLKPSELLSTQHGPELIQVLELLLLDRQTELAQRLVERLAVNFASQEPVERMRCAEQFLEMARKASQELRAAWYGVAVRRLGDALELETNLDAMEKLAECAKLAILDRIAEGDWDLAARLVWSIGRRRAGRAEAGRGGDAQGRVSKLAARTLAEVLDDPRGERIWETIETGSQQERRKAARILEGMGAAAVDRLLRALMTTNRARVESFLIDMLAALAPESEVALQRQVTPFSTPDQTVRLIRASAVVCQDPTAVLVTGLQHQDQLVQAEAVAVARGVGGKVAQKVLSWALQNGTPAAQLTAVKHLGELTRPDALDELLDLLQKTTLMEVQREICLAVGKMSLSRPHHDKVVPVLSGLLRTGSFLRAEYPEDVRAAAAWALGQMKTVEAARKALEKLLEDKDKRVRLTAKLALQGRQ